MDFPLTDLMDEDACYAMLVNKEYPHQYTAIFQWGYNIIKRVTGEFIRSLLGVRDPTS